MQHTSPPTRLLIALAAATALLLGACSTSGGEEGTATTTTAAEGAETTTTADGGDDETTTTGDEGDAPTVEDLEAILPEPGDLGEGWTTDPSSSDDDEDDKTLEEQCPEAAALTQNDDDGTDDVERSFSDPDDRQLEVSLDASARSLETEELADAVDAINACEEITVEDTEKGTTTSFTFEATVDEVYGDQGIRIQADVTVESDQLPQPIELTLYGLSFRNGTVGVNVTGTDGLDTTTYEAVEFDTDVLIGVADDLDARIDDLQG